MATILSLPNELLDQIFDDPNLWASTVAITRTCKKFHAVGNRTLYRFFPLTGAEELMRKGPLRQKVQSFLKYSPYVREAFITSADSKTCPRLHIIIPAFKSLTTLHLGSRITLPYTTHLPIIATSLKLSSLRSLSLNIHFGYSYPPKQAETPLTPSESKRGITKVRELEKELESYVSSQHRGSGIRELDLKLTFTSPMRPYTYTAPKGDEKRYAREVVDLMSILRFFVKKVQSLTYEIEADMYINAEEATKGLGWKWEMPELKYVYRDIYAREPAAAAFRRLMSWRREALVDEVLVPCLCRCEKRVDVTDVPHF